MAIKIPITISGIPSGAKATVTVAQRPRMMTRVLGFMLLSLLGLGESELGCYALLTERRPCRDNRGSLPRVFFAFVLIPSREGDKMAVRTLACVPVRSNFGRVSRARISMI